MDFLILIMLLIWLLPIVFAGKTLHMIDAAAKTRRRPVKLMLVDLFSLIFLIQIPYAVGRYIHDETTGALIVAMAVFTLAMIAVWWTTIKSVSKAGIHSVSDRAWISFLVIPAAYVGSFAIVGVGIAILNASTEKSIIDLILIEVILIGLLGWSYFVARNIVRNSLEIQSKDVEVTRVPVSPFDD